MSMVKEDLIMKGTKIDLSNTYGNISVFKKKKRVKLKKKKKK